MLGYITVNKDELKIREYKEYRSYYCGLCRTLKRRCGSSSRVMLTYDMTFLVLLLTGLYEPQSKHYVGRCVAHLAQKEDICENEYTEYAADMNILLAYYDLMDDWQDEKKADKLVLAKILEKSHKKIAQKYPIQHQAILRYVEQLRQCEETGERNPDCAAGYTGELLGEIFAYRQDMWRGALYKIGYYLGKFIYLMDAYEDMEKDKKQGSYNPFLLYFVDKQMEKKEEEQICYQILRMIIAEAAKEFEKLPILENGEIIRNILYSGVWVHYERVRQQRTKGNSEV